MQLKPIWTLASAALVLASGCSPTPAAKADVPPGPVVDRAEIIPAAEELQLDRELRDFHERTGKALVVATVPSLDGKSIEEFATSLFSEWGIGDAKTNQGLLFLVAPHERKVRIEVGYGLEKVVTHVAAAHIIQGAILPSFRKSDFVTGINEGVDALMVVAQCGEQGAAPTSEISACSKVQSQ